MAITYNGGRTFPNNVNKPINYIRLIKKFDTPQTNREV